MHVLCVYNNTMFSYPLKDESSIQELQAVLEKEMHIPVNQQELLLASGIPPDPAKPAMQCWTEPVSQNHAILTISDPNLLTYGLISMVWTVKNNFDADVFNIDWYAVRQVVSIRRGLR